MAKIQLTARDIAFLQMLEDGASSKEIGRRMGLTPGSTRVYLCELYKELELPTRNKATAVAWFIHFKSGAPVATLCLPADKEANNFKSPASSPALPRARFIGSDFGDAALEWGLLHALGGMSIYAGASNENKPPQPRLNRLLWEWLLAGDFASATDYALALPKQEEAKLAPFEIALLSASLLLGRKIGEGKRLEDRLAEISTGPENKVLAALSELISSDERSAWLDLHHLATQPLMPRPAKHLAMVVLFHLYRKNGRAEHAHDTANAIGAELEAVRDSLRGTHLPNPAYAIPELAQEMGA